MRLFLHQRQTQDHAYGPPPQAQMPSWPRPNLSHIQMRRKRKTDVAFLSILSPFARATKDDEYSFEEGGGGKPHSV